MKYQANPVIVDAEIIVGTGTILSGGSVHCALQNGDNKVATKEMISRFVPNQEGGDYWVTQPNGYEYLNPKAVFESKYSPVKSA